MANVLNVTDSIPPSQYNIGTANRQRSYTTIPTNGRRLDVNQFTKRFIIQDGLVQQEVEVNPKTGDVRPVGPAQERTPGYLRSIIEWRDLAANGVRYEDLPSLDNSPIERNVSWNEYKCKLEGGKCDRILRESDAIQIVYFDHNWLRYLVHLPGGFRLAPGQTGDKPYELSYRTSGIEYLLPTQAELVSKDSQGRYIACAKPPIVIKGRRIGDTTCSQFNLVEINLATGTFSEIICPDLANKNPHIIRQDSDLLSEDEWRMYRLRRQIEYPTRLAASTVAPITATERSDFQTRERERLRLEAEQKRQQQQQIFANPLQKLPLPAFNDGRIVVNGVTTPVYPTASVQGLDANGNIVVALPSSARNHPVVGSLFTSPAAANPCEPQFQEQDLPNVIDFGKRKIELEVDMPILFNLPGMSVMEAAARMPADDDQARIWRDWVNLNKNDAMQLNATDRLFDVVLHYYKPLYSDFGIAIERMQEQRANMGATIAQIESLREMVKSIPRAAFTPQQQPSYAPVSREAECFAENERLRKELEEIKLRERETQARNAAQAQQAFVQSTGAQTLGTPRTSPSRAPLAFNF
jgi:hypothetical protein